MKTYELREANALLFANSDVILISHDGKCFRVPTDSFRTTTLLRAAGDLLQIAAGRTNVRGTDRPDADSGDCADPGVLER